MTHPSLEEFLHLSNQQLAEMMHTFGQLVCVFPFNGTRRWFLLEHQDTAHENFAKLYVEETTKGYIRTYELLFDHGIDTVIAPVFGSEILNRGEDYMREIGAGMGLLAEHPEFLSFYEKYDIRVNFYGDYRKELKQTQYAYISGQFDAVIKRTAANKKHRLFYGVFASDATQSIAELSIQHYIDTGHIPTRKEIIERYYGEYIEKANIFIGFEKFTVFDYPILNWGEESLYFTVAPSLYMTKNQLRKILYDHLYLRPVPEPDYQGIQSDDIETLRRFYEVNRETTLGVGEVRNGIWYSKSNIKE